MKRMLKVFAFGALATMSHAGGASAQVTFANGVTGTSSSTPYTDGTLIDLGSSTTVGVVTQMPLSLSYGNVNVDIAFTGNSRIFSGSSYFVSTSHWGDQNYFSASAGSVVMNFSTAQNMLSFDWGSPGSLDQVAFYNGSQLLMTTGHFGAGMTKVFNLNELGFDRVVMSTTGNAFEFANVRFASADPAPLPLGGVGGLAALLFMLASRRSGLSRGAPMWALSSSRRILPARV